MNKLYLFIILTFIGFHLQATTQFKDLLIIQNDTFFIKSPLDCSDHTFKKIWYERISDTSCVMTACWRGAICVWRLDNDSIFLTKIVSCCDRNKEFDLSSIWEAPTRIFAEWITGVFDYQSGIKICLNPFFMPVTERNLYIYEFDNILVINKGKAIEKLWFDNSKTNIGVYNDRDSLFDQIAFRLKEIECDGSTYLITVSFESNENGEIENIQVEGVFDPKVVENIRWNLKDLCGLPVYYRFGKKEYQSWEFEFIIE